MKILLLICGLMYFSITNVKAIGYMNNVYGKDGSYQGFINTNGSFNNVYGKDGSYQGFINTNGSFNNVYGKDGSYQGFIGN